MAKSSLLPILLDFSRVKFSMLQPMMPHGRDFEHELVILIEQSYRLIDLYWSFRTVPTAEYDEQTRGTCGFDLLEG